MRLLSLIIGLTLLYGSRSASTYDDEELNKANEWLNTIYNGTSLGARFGNGPAKTYDDEDMNSANNWLNMIIDGTSLGARFGNGPAKTYDDEDMNSANNWLNMIIDGTSLGARFGNGSPTQGSKKCTSSSKQDAFCVKKELCLEAALPVDPTTRIILREGGNSCTSSETCCLKIRDDQPTTNKRTNDFKTCTTDQQQEGVCVKKSLCSNAVQTVDPTTLYIPRERTSCHALEACCLESNVKPVVVKPPNPNINLGCGWSNPGANIFRDKTSASGLADYGEFPWMVALIKKENANNGWNESYAGGGALIHPSVVITAAHKVSAFKPTQMKIRAGEWDTRTEAEVYPYQDIDVTKIIIHENYESAHALNNVALVILKSPVNLINAPHIGVACLAPQLPPPGTRCFGMGWGSDFLNNEAYAVILKKLELPLVEASVCEKQLQGTILTSRYRLDMSLTCAGGEKGVDTCVGDGGSPLVCPVAGESERFAVVGLTAYGVGCGENQVPGVYVNVPFLNDWVGRQMTSNHLSKASFEY